VPGTFTAIFDACVLYPFTLRSLLVQLATTDLVLGRWTDAIHEEWIGAVLEQNAHIRRESLEEVRRLMDRAVLDCLVTGYEPLAAGIALPDEKDRHVLAVAICCGAGVIVTKNLRHFPSGVLDPLGIEAQHPDDFVSSLLDLSPSTVCSCVRACRVRLKNPPKTVEEYLTTLERQESSKTVAELRPFADLL
jgi:hypothetical protein